MKRPTALIPAAALMALLAAAGCPGSTPSARNVLLITLDTLRADRVGSYGSDRGLTPRLDALAAEGVRFANAFSPVPLTGPSHASMLTGRYPITHGLRNNGTMVLAEEEVLASEVLHERGFRTAAIVSALVLSSEFGIDQGFDLYYEEGIKGTKAGSGLWFNHRPGDQSVDRALTWLRASSDRPFFLWVHLFDPHDPYMPPPPFDALYPGRPYDGEVAFTDAQVGRLLDALREMGLYDDTLIIAAADHGEGLGDHMEPYHAIFAYDTTLKVPLIMRVPGGSRGRVVEDLVSLLDVGPTILDGLGMPIPEGAQGSSLIGAAAGETIADRPLFLETIMPTTSYGWATVRALVKPSWKLIDLPVPELYDTTADPREQENLHDREPDRAAEIRSEYRLLVDGLEATARRVENVAVDDATRDALLSLGYIGGQQSLSTDRVGPDPKAMAQLLAPLNQVQGKMKDRRYAEAEEILRLVLNADPDNRMALVQIGKTLALLRKLDEAIPFYEHAITTYPDVEEFYRNYGLSLLNFGRLEPARDVFERALKELPESAHMHLMLGYTWFIERNWEKAAAELDLAIKLKHTSGKPYYLLAICALQDGDEGRAIDLLDEYLDRDRDVDSIFNDPYFIDLKQTPAFQEMIRRHL